jgi:hypothetical protein
VNKLAPVSEQAKAALEALQDTKTGFGYMATLPDGTTKQFVEGQIIAMVLDDLRKQVSIGDWPRSEV